MTAALQSNVVALPTAAKRKVRQPHFQTRAYYRAKDEVPQLPVEFRTAPQRRAERMAATLFGMEKSAALLIATAIFQTLDTESQLKVQAYCTMLVDTDEGQQATAWLELIAGDFGTKSMVRCALRRLAEQGL